MRRRPCGGSGTGHGQITEDELLTLQKSGQFPDEPVRILSHTNSLCKRPDVLVIEGIKKIELGGRLL